jgi:hypothetical protein
MTHAKDMQSARSLVKRGYKTNKKVEKLKNPTI